MNNKVRILLRIDANHDVGMGHAVRASLLLSLIRTPYKLFIIGQGAWLRYFFPGARLFASGTEEESALAALISRCGVDVLMFDHPRSGALDWGYIRDYLKLPSIVIDDWGGRHMADLIINGTVVPVYHSYPAVPVSSEILVGPQYALVHHSFGQMKWQKKEHGPKQVTIVIGSGDRAKEWAFRLLSGDIDFQQWGNVRLVVGHAFPEVKAVQSKAANARVLVFRGIPSEDLSLLLASSDAVLCTGGGIVYESLAVGVPTVVFPQIDNLISEAEWFAERGCVINLGYEKGMSMSRVEEAVVCILRNPRMAVDMSGMALKIIDGKGMFRTAAAIDRLFSRRYGA